MCYSITVIHEHHLGRWKYILTRPLPLMPNYYLEQANQMFIACSKVFLRQILLYVKVFGSKLKESGNVEGIQ